MKKKIAKKNRNKIFNLGIVLLLFIFVVYQQSKRKKKEIIELYYTLLDSKASFRYQIQKGDQIWKEINNSNKNATDYLLYEDIIRVTSNNNDYTIVYETELHPSFDDEEPLDSDGIVDMFKSGKYSTDVTQIQNLTIFENDTPVFTGTSLDYHKEGSQINASYSDNTYTTIFYNISQPDTKAIITQTNNYVNLKFEKNI